MDEVSRTHLSMTHAFQVIYTYKGKKNMAARITISNGEQYTYRELQKKLKSLGIKAKGKATELKARYEEYLQGANKEVKSEIELSEDWHIDPVKKERIEVLKEVSELVEEESEDTSNEMAARALQEIDEKLKLQKDLNELFEIAKTYKEQAESSEKLLKDSLDAIKDTKGSIENYELTIQLLKQKIKLLTEKVDELEIENFELKTDKAIKDIDESLNIFEGAVGVLRNPDDENNEDKLDVKYDPDEVVGDLEELFRKEHTEKLEVYSSRQIFERLVLEVDEVNEVPLTNNSNDVLDELFEEPEYLDILIDALNNLVPNEAPVVEVLEPEQVEEISNESIEPQAIDVESKEIDEWEQAYIDEFVGLIQEKYEECMELDEELDEFELEIVKESQAIAEDNFQEWINEINGFIPTKGERDSLIEEINNLREYYKELVERKES